MQITNVRFSKTIQSAQYEPEELEANAILEEGDDFEKCASELRYRITKTLGRKVTGLVTPEVTAPTADTSEKAPTGKKRGAPPSSSSQAKKKKPITYDREVKAHQTELGKILHEVSPDWKTDNNLKARAKVVSVNLVGSDFMNADGNVLDSFKTKVKEAMGGSEDSSSL